MDHDRKFTTTDSLTTTTHTIIHTPTTIQTITYTLFSWQRTVIADNIIDGHTDGKGHASINGAAILVAFGKQFLRRGVNDRVSKFTNLQYLGAHHALLYQALECQIDNLGGFLVFGANVAVMGDSDSEGEKEESERFT